MCVVLIQTMRMVDAGAGDKGGAVAALPAPGATNGVVSQQLTAAQTATQLALAHGDAATGGKVPVRTGLAWVPLGVLLS